MENSLGFAHFLANSDAIARFILVLMSLMSIGSWYLIVTKAARHIITRHRSNAFLTAFWAADSLDGFAHRSTDAGVAEPFSHLLQHGLAAIEQHGGTGDGQKSASLINGGTPDQFLIRALKRGIAQSRTRLEYGQTFLATVASSAPFVGLFGTVWGIYHALLAIGISGQGTLDKVAGPVGEALIMTAIGLAVAIPAAIAYNIFARANRNNLAELNAFADDLFNLFATGIKARFDGNTMAAKSEREHVPTPVHAATNISMTHTHATI